MMSPSLNTSRLRRRSIALLAGFALLAGSATAGLAKPKDDKAAKAAAAAEGKTVDPNKPVKLKGDAKLLVEVRRLLEVSDDEWLVLQPRLQKVSDLLKESEAGIDPKGPKPPKQPKPDEKVKDGPMSAYDVRSRANDLSAAWFDPSAPTYVVRERIAALHAARDRVRHDLSAAREDLRGLLTVRQEAVLEVLGLLD